MRENDQVTRRAGRALCLSIFAVFGAGCGISAESFGTAGQLGNGSFRYECVSTNDSACAGDSTGGLIPTEIGVGGEFKLIYYGATPTTEDGVSFQVTVVPASPEMVDETSQGFRITRAGEIAFLARGANGMVADITHVQASKIASIGISSSNTPVDSLTLAMGETVLLAAQPMDEEDQVLGGTYEYAWSTSNDAVAAVTTDMTAAEVSVVGTSTGQATITVGIGEAQRQIPVTVRGDL